MRRAARTDSNQVSVVKALRKAGAVVTHLHTLGRGVPDIMCSYDQRWMLMEIKSKGGKLTKDEKAWIAAQRAPVYIVFSPEEAVELLNLTRRV